MASPSRHAPSRRGQRCQSTATNFFVAGAPSLKGKTGRSRNPMRFGFFVKPNSRAADSPHLSPESLCLAPFTIFREEMPPSSQPPDYYETLGVQRAASDAEIKKA